MVTKRIIITVQQQIVDNKMRTVGDSVTNNTIAHTSPPIMGRESGSDWLTRLGPLFLLDIISLAILFGGKYQ